MTISNLVASNPYAAGASASFYLPVYAQQQSIANLSQAAASTQTQISSFGQIGNALSTLQSAAQNLSGADAFSAKTASSSAPDVVSATASAQAVAGQYSVMVNQLAQGETLVSSSQSSSNAHIGSGVSTAVTFSFANGQQQSLTINGNNNTLAGIADAINRANLGITASTNTNTAGTQLALTGKTGAANAFAISVSGDGAISNLLSHPPVGAIGGLTQVVAARDATGSINGASIQGGSNTHSQGGIILNFNNQGSARVNVTPDAAQITAGIQAFINAYNTLQNTVTTLQSGTLSADHTLSTIRAQISSAANVGALAQIGISTGANGSLSLDINTLQNALSSNAAGVIQTFKNGGNGIAENIASAAQSLLQPGGAIPTAVSGLQSRVQLDKQLQHGVMTNANQMQQTMLTEYSQLRTSLLNSKGTDQFLMSQLYQATQIQGMLPQQSLQLGDFTPHTTIYV